MKHKLLILFLVGVAVGWVFQQYFTFPPWTTVQSAASGGTS